MKIRPFCLIACTLCVLIVILHTLGLTDRTEKCRSALTHDVLFGQAGLQNWDEVLAIGQITHVAEKEDGLTLKIRRAALAPADVPLTSSGLPRRSVSLRRGCLLQVSLSDSAALPVSGQMILVRGKIVFPEGPTCPGQFDQLRYANVNGIIASVVSASVQRHAASASRDTLLETIRRRVMSAYEKVLSPEDAGTMAAITLGEKTSLSAEKKRLFQDGGISHILAISGLHINLLGMSLYRLLRRRRLPITFCALCSSLTLLLYCAMTGMSRSALRAAIMFSVWCLAQVTGRSSDTLSALALSACLLLSASPLSVFDGGFQLSFGCILSLALLGPFFQAALRVKKTDTLSERLRASLSSTLAITVGTLPVMCWHFYQFNPYAPLINLVVIPSMSLLAVSGFAGALLGCLSVSLGISAAAPCHYLLTLFCRLCELLLKLPGACLVTGRPGLWQVLLYYVLLFLLVNSRKVKPWTRAALLSLCLAGLCTLFPLRHTGRMIFLDVGQGLCVIIQSGRSAIVYDGGSSSIDAVFAYRMEPALKSMGIRHVTLMNSHGDLDHLSGFSEWADMYRQNLIGEGMQGITVDRICFSSLAAQDDTSLALARAWQSRFVSVSFLPAGQSLRLGPWQARVLYPGDDDYAESSNENSMVLLVSHRSGVRTLLTGDLEKEAEDRFTARLHDLGRIDLLCLGHHGSKYATSEGFLSCFTPRFAIASAGKNNRYHHPSREVMERLQLADIPLYRTDQQGSIVMDLSASGRLRLRTLGTDARIEHLIQ